MRMAHGPVAEPLLFLIYVGDRTGGLENPRYSSASGSKLFGPENSEAVQSDLNSVHYWSVTCGILSNLSKYLHWSIQESG